jgi:hypothetical protein
MQNWPAQTRASLCLASSSHWSPGNEVGRRYVHVAASVFDREPAKIWVVFAQVRATNRILIQIWTIEGFKNVTVTRRWVCIIAISYVLTLFVILFVYINVIHTCTCNLIIFAHCSLYMFRLRKKMAWAMFIREYVMLFIVTACSL